LEVAVRLHRRERDALLATLRELQQTREPAAAGQLLLAGLRVAYGVQRAALFVDCDQRPRLLGSLGLQAAVVSDLAVKPTSILVRTDHSPLGVGPLEIRDRFDPDDDAWLDALMPRARDLIAVSLETAAISGVLIVDLGGVPSRRLLRSAQGVRIFAEHGIGALDAATEFVRLGRLASTDGLTGLANRRTFDEVLTRELARAQRTDGRLSVVLVDIDRFKQLNDTHGHVAGDAVLRALAAALRACAREYDVVTRFGGEEFAAVLPGCSSRLAFAVAERLRRAIEQSETMVPVTASCGVATYPQDALDTTGLLEAADEALYASKSAGRNCVHSAEQARQIDRWPELSVARDAGQLAAQGSPQPLPQH
jgi:diguanylate cyclase (GGDEF)-like protein